MSSKILFLTSDGMNGVEVRKEIVKILPKPANQIKLAHIITASKPEEDTSYVESDKRQMIKLGFQVEDVDIEGKNESELRNLLKSKDVIYVQGGNTFYLLKHIKESSFDKVVKELIGKGVIYIGASAGSYLACPTIEMANWKHPDINIVELKDLTALNLVPFLLSVHYQPKYRSVLKKEISNASYPTRILADNQAFLVKNGRVKLVGRGREIRI